jgi:NADH-quinone oxidoreductase subunit N
VTVSVVLVEAGLVLAGALVAMALDAFGSRRAAAVAALGGFVMAATAGAVSAISPEIVAGGVTFAGSSLASTGAAIALLAGLALMGGWRRFTAGVRGGEASALIALSAAGAIGTLWARDLVTLLVLLEVVGLAGYALVALAGTSASRESAMKYFVQGAVATGLAVFGVGILYAASGGVVTYAGILEAVRQPATAALSRPLLAGSALVLVALGFKVGAFPMHSWVPDAYETADAVDAAFLASVPKLAAMVALAVVVLTALGRDASTGPRILIALLATGSIVVGNLGALRQTSLRRMLAYSGIAQAGYALVSLTGLDRGQSILVFAPLYGLAALGAFLAASAVRETDSGWDGSIAGLSGLASKRPGLAASLAVCLLSLLGLPLTAGFFAKFLVFGTAIGAGYTWLAIVGVLGSVVSFGYYGRVIRVMYLEDGDGDTRAARRSAGPASRTVATIACAVVVLGVVPTFEGIAWLMTALGLR